jgi:hypothetical protein
MSAVSRAYILWVLDDDEEDSLTFRDRFSNWAVGMINPALCSTFSKRGIFQTISGDIIQIVHKSWRIDGGSAGSRVQYAIVFSVWPDGPARRRSGPFPLSIAFPGKFPRVFTLAASAS